MNILYMAHQNRHINVSPFKLTIKLTAARKKKKVKYSNCFINRELSLEIGKEQARQDYIMTFPGDLDGCLNSARLLQVSRALLQNCLSSGAQAAPPRGPRHPQASPTYFTRGDFLSPHAPFLASKRTCWETL